MTILKKFIFTLRQNYYLDKPLWLDFFVIGFCFGCSLYFILPFSAISNVIFWAMAAITVISCLLFFLKPQFGFFYLIFFGFMLGYGHINFYFGQHNLNMLNTPVRKALIYGKIEKISNRPANKSKEYRLVLKNVVVNNEPIKAKLRLNVLQNLLPDVNINGEIHAMADIYPIPGKVTVQGIDPRQKAYFDGVYATARLKELKHYKQAPYNSIQSHRQKLTHFWIKNLPEPIGAIAAALTTGDTSYIPQNVRDAYADTGLSHLLAISGLHLGIIAGFIFLLFRRILCLYPPIVLNYPVKIYASILALFVCTGYLVLAGFGTPVVRSFIMVLIVVVAMLFQRTAFSTRSLSIAAFVILLLQPYLVISPSFQLSFAAVLALLAGYHSMWPKIKGLFIAFFPQPKFYQKILFSILGLAFTSIIATLATTPFSLFFFQKLTLKSIFANIIAVPLMTFFIMPLAIVALIGYSLGFYSFALTWGHCLETLQLCTNLFAKIPWGSFHVHYITNLCFTLYVIGFVWLCFLRQKWRFLGFFPIIVSFTLVFYTPIPIAYFSLSKNAGLIIDKGKGYSFGKYNSYLHDQWLKEAGLKNITNLTDSKSVSKKHEEMNFEFLTQYRFKPKSSKKNTIVFHIQPKYLRIYHNGKKLRLNWQSTYVVFTKAPYFFDTAHQSNIFPWSDQHYSIF